MLFETLWVLCVYKWRCKSEKRSEELSCTQNKIKTCEFLMLQHVVNNFANKYWSIPRVTRVKQDSFDIFSTKTKTQHVDGWIQFVSECTQTCSRFCIKFKRNVRNYVTRNRLVIFGAQEMSAGMPEMLKFESSESIPSDSIAIRIWLLSKKIFH